MKSEDAQTPLERDATTDTPHHDVSDEEVFRRIAEAEENPDVLLTAEQLISGLRFRQS